MSVNKIFHIINSFDLQYLRNTLHSLCKGYEIVRVDEQTDLEELVNQLKQDTLFSQPTIWLFNRSDCFSSNEAFKKHYQFLTTLLTFNQTSIFVVNSLSKSKDVINFIDQYAQLYNSFDYNEKTAFDYVLKLCFDLQINLTDHQVESLIAATGYDINLLHNEIHKLSLLNKHIINDQEFNDLVSDYSSELIFKILDYLYNKQIKQAIKIVDYLLSIQTNEITIINTLSTMICKHYYLKKLTELNYNSEDIADALKMKVFNVRIQQKKLVNFASDWIIAKIKMLLNFDYQIKINQIDKNHALFQWILSFYHLSI